MSGSGYDSSAFGRVMFEELTDRIHQTWSERHTWLSRAFDVHISGTAASQDMMTLVELRNALVHGAGRLTHRQTRGVGALIELEKRLQVLFSVRADSRGLVLAPDSATRAVEVARAYILALDAELKTQHSQVAL
jgi:hypothetical protein